MIRPRFLLAALAATAAASAGCPPPPVVATSFSFNRPVSVDFVCLRVPVGSDGRITAETMRMGAEVEAFAVGQCPSVTATSTSDVQAAGAGFVGLRLFALVTQADRGEVAVVNLHPRFNTGNVDTQPRVPGFTFIPTGAFAGALAVHPSGRATYVANTGENTISILDNRRLLAGRNFALQANGAPLTITGLPSPPVDLVLRSFGDQMHALYVLLQDGSIQIYNVNDPLVAPVLQSTTRLQATTMATDAGVDSGADTGVDTGVDSGVDTGVDDSATASDDADAGGDASADVADVTDSGVAPADSGIDSGIVADTGTDSGTSMDAALDAAATGRVLPEKIAVADDGRVFVSDRGLPIIHVLEPDGSPTRLREVTPLRSGVPTTQIAVSPRLPSDGTHWVYAITTGDRQLIALDATLVGGVPTATYGERVRANAIADHPDCMRVPFDERACPKIDPVLPHDRVPIRAPARSVGFIATSVRGESGQVSCDVSQPLVEACTATPQPRLDIFRGVQAVVALANAQIQVVDLEDPDRNCAVRVGQSVQRAFLRHIPRGGDSTTRPSLIGAPALTINGGSASLGGANPRLVATNGSDTTCDMNNDHCVELPRQPTAATLVDPVAVRDATYLLRFEGQLPLRTINAASFAPVAGEARARLQAPGSRFCQLGALAGDRIVLNGPSPYVENNVRADASVPIPTEDPQCPAAQCRAAFGDTNLRCNREFAVRRATQDALEIDLPRTTVAGNEFAGEACGIVQPPAGSSGFAASAAEFTRLLSCCYPQATRVEVRASNRWVLAITPSGRGVEFPNDVVERGGECVSDPTIGPSGRVAENETYDARWFRIRIASGSQPTPRDAAITFRTGGGYAQLVSNSGAAGATVVRHQCASDRVYVVDQTPASLREYSIAPFVLTRTFN